MTSPIEALFGADLLPATDFPPSSRYAGIAVRVTVAADGSPVRYLARRFVPSPDRFAALSAYRIVQGDRLDRIAARLVGDAERFWALCDANGAIWPDELEQPGGTIRVTLPIDVPAPADGG